MHQKQSLMEGYCHRPCFFFAWLFFNILVSVLWRFVALPGYYILTCCPHSPVLFLFFFSPSLIPLFSLFHYFCCLSSSVSCLHQYSSVTPPFLLSISVCLCLPLHLFLSLPLPYFLLLFTPSLSSYDFHFPLYNITSSPLLSSAIPQSSSQDPTAMSTSSGVDHAVIGGVVAVIVFILLCLLIVLGRYLIRHKGQLPTRLTTQTCTDVLMHACMSAPWDTPA